MGYSRGVGEGAPSVLIVDDDAAIRRLHQIVLQERGFDVHVAADGESALSAAVSLRPDVVLLDWRLPTESGLAVCRRLTSRMDPQRPVVVMLTGLDDADDRAAAHAAGAAAFLTKPVSPDELDTTLRGVLAAEPRVASG